LLIPNNVAADMVVGLPKSADTQKWDITAKLPSSGQGAPSVVGGRTQPPPFSVALEMLRGLLQDQFELKTHTENREVTVYAITQQANRKPKMTLADDTERATCRGDSAAINLTTKTTASLDCKNTSMSELAERLQMTAFLYVDHPLVDAT